MRVFATLLLISFSLKLYPHNLSELRNIPEFPGSYALVAGGSKGIGLGISEALAKRKFNLVIVARGAEGLQAAKSKIEGTYNVKVETLQMDLAYEESALKIAGWCLERKLPVKVLCNVAGLGGTNDYLKLPLDSLRYMVNLNLESVMALTLCMLPVLEQNSPSYILNVSSMSGFAPIPSKNLYSATKSAVIYFSYALHYQLRDKNISVSCLAPGPVYTKPSIEADTRKRLGRFGDMLEIPASRVGEIAVKKTLRKKMMIVPGFWSSVSAGFIRLMPKRVVLIAYDMLERQTNKPTPPPQP